jgi:hypothetical protein
VTAYEPAGVDAEVDSVRVELAPAVTDAGLNDADAPVGKPDADSVTCCADPAVTTVDTVAVTL